MKNIYFLILFSCFSIVVKAQQDLFKYQAVARDASGMVMKNQSIALQFKIVEDNANQAVHYSETHQVTTNDLGIFHLNIGDGTVTQGLMENINWSSGNYLLNVAVDYSGGSNYADLGAIPFLSVPYALHAKTVADKDDADADPSNELQTLSLNGAQLSISGGNTINLPTGGMGGGNDEDPNNEIQNLSAQKNGNSVQLEISLGNTTTFSVDDLDPNPSNELQTLSKTGNTVSLSNGGGSFTDMVNDGDADNTNELQQLSVSGNQLTISNGNTVNLPTGGLGGGNDEDPNNEIQVLTRNGDFVELSLGGGIVDITDGDADSGNEIQSLSLTGNTLDLSSSNSVDLSPITSPWKPKGADQIEYEGLTAKVVHPTDAAINTNIEPGFVETNGHFGTALIDGQNLDFTNPSFGSAYTRYGYDGVTFDQPGVGLLLPQYTYLSSFGLEMDNSVEQASFNNNGVYLEDAVNAFDLRIDRALFRKDDGTQTFYDAANFNCDSLAYKNSADWPSTTIGTNALGQGFMKLYEGGNTNTSFEFGRTFFGDPSFEMSKNGIPKNVIEIFGDAGYMMTYGNTTPNTFVGNVPLNDERGEIRIMDEFNSTRAAMTIDEFGESVIRTDGRYEVRDGFGNLYSRSDFGGYELLSPNGNAVAAIHSDLFEPVGNMATYGKNGGLNFIAGADYGGLGTNGGYAAVCDSNSITKVAMGIQADNSGRLFAEGTMDIINANGQIASSMNKDEIKLVEAATANPVARLARYSASQRTGELRLAGENNLLNIFSGPNFLNADLSAGLLAVADQQGTIQGGVQCLSDGRAQLFGNEMTLLDRNGFPSIVASTDGHNNGSITTMSTEGNFLSYIGSSFTNSGTGMMAIFGQGGINKGSLQVNSNTGRGQLDVDDVNAQALNAEQIIVAAAGLPKAYIGSYLGANDFGAIEVYDNAHTAQAGIYVDPITHQGTVWGDTKNFRMDHPEDVTKDIVYASLEGPEAAAYSRGTAALEKGRVFVEFSEHYKLVSNPETMTIQLTPLYANTIGLAVVEKTSEGFWVEERMGGAGNFDFDWTATCVRKGYEDFKVVRNKK